MMPVKYTVFSAVAGALLLAAPAQAQNGGLPYVIAPAGATDFHIQTRGPIMDLCFLIVPCDRVIEAGPWGPQKDTNVPLGDPDGYLNTWEGSALTAGDKLTFSNLPLNLFGDPDMAGNNLILASWWTNPNGPMTPTDGTITFYAVPEPTTWAMLIAGFGLVGLRLRSRTRGSGGRQVAAMASTGR